MRGKGRLARLFDLRQLTVIVSADCAKTGSIELRGNPLLLTIQARKPAFG